MKLYYVHDPMCSWCWAFSPVWGRFRSKLLKQVYGVEIRYVLGGLAADSDDVMSDEMKAYIQTTWKTIIHSVPGTYFNFDFWKKCEPKRSTYPACRAVLSADNLKAGMGQKMIREIQQAYYENAKNPSDIEVLSDLADNLGLDVTCFQRQMMSVEVQQQLNKQIDFARNIGGVSFPSLFFEFGSRIYPIKINYLDADLMLDQIGRLLDDSK